MRVAALTMMHNEPVWARAWARHYTREVGAENCLVLDHGSTDGSTRDLGVRVERVGRGALDEDARAALVSDVTRELLRGYDAVVHSDADELVLADPDRFADLRDYASRAPRVATAVGLDLHHIPGEEGALRPGEMLGGQRRWVRFSAAMCKPALVQAPVRWRPGFHACDAAPVFGALYLVHLRYADLDAGLARLRRTRAQTFAQADTNPHQRVGDEAFEGMMRAIARLPLAGEAIMGGAVMAPWMMRMREGWARGDGQLALAGDALWALPDGVLARI